MNICRKCGAVLREGDKYCSKCGARASKGRIEAHRKNAQKKRQEKEITFRTKPAHSSGYRENFEEGENRSHALLVTVTILVVMMLAVAAFAMFYFVQKRSIAGKNGFGSAIEIISEGAVQETTPQTQAPDAAASGTQVTSESQAGGETSSEVQAAGEAAPEIQAAGEASSETQAQSEAASGTQAQSEASEAASGTQTQSEAASETQAQSETATEAPVQTETEAVTEAATPSAADVIDPSQIQSIIDSESTATSAEVYIYDLKHDSEAALNDCTQPMYASALITIPILYTAASKIDAGELTMDDQITYVTSIGGRGELTTETRDGQNFPLSFYLQTMTNYSDNNCTNILIDYLGLDAINATCQAAGYASVNMERGLVATDPGGLDNYVSAKDVTMMVKDLYTGKFACVGEDYMRQYFKISETDSLPTLIGLAPDLADAAAVLNQNGHGMTRYNEVALIEDGGALYILTIMLYGDSGMVYSPAVTDIAQYVCTTMAGQA